jgi:uncharacterized protein
MHSTGTEPLYIFEHRGSWYAFRSLTVDVVPVDSEEAAFLKACQETDVSRAGSSLEWESPRVERARESLSRKGLFSSSASGPSFPAHEYAEINPVSRNVEILVNASQTCNLNCEYCFVDKGQFGYTEDRVLYLSPDHARQLIKVLPEALPWVKEFCIHFYGGEPLLNVEAMKAAVKAAREYNGLFTFAITTNGTVINDEVFAILREGKFSIVLSVDGPAEAHNTMRKTKQGGPTHGMVMQFLERLRQPPKLLVRGSAVVRRGWTLREAEAYLQSIDVDLIKAQAVRLPEDNPLMLNEKEKKQYIVHLGEVADSIIQGLKRGVPPKDDRFNQRVLQLLKKTRRVSFCGAAQWSFGVSADGTVLPCVLLAGVPGTELGHIDDPFHTWVEQGRKWAEAHGPRAECESCWALPLCGGGCPAMLHVCGEDECELTRANCDLALRIYVEFYDNLVDLLYLAGIRDRTTQPK